MAPHHRTRNRQTSNNNPHSTVGRNDRVNEHHPTTTLATLAAYNHINNDGWTILGVGPDKKPLGPWSIGGWNRFDHTNAEDVFTHEFHAIGIITGPSRTVIIDIDNEEAIRAWATKNGVPTTRIVNTPRGKHLYYHAPNGNNLAPTVNLMPGIDIRAGESYAIIPPSITNGGIYTWTNNNPIETLPETILNQLAKNNTPEQTRIPSGDPIPEGRRNHELFSRALKAVRIGLSREAVYGAIRGEAEAHAEGDITETELRSIVKSAFAYHDKNPQKTLNTNPSIINVTTFSSMPAPQAIHWLRGETGRGRIPLGEMTMIYGEPGVGKGSITMSIIAEVTQAGGRVLVSTPEDDPLRVVKPRLIATKADLDLVSHITSTRGENETTIDIATEADKIIEAAISFGAELIIIDPVSEHFAANVKDERENREQLSPFMRACREHQIAVLAIGHTNRMTGGSGYMRAGGSSALFKIARSAFIVGRVPTPDDDQDTVTKNVALIHDKMNLGRAMPGVVYSINTHEFIIDDGTPITTSLATKIGETNLTTEDILDERRVAEQRKIGECAAWMSTYLTDRLGLANKEDLDNDARKVDQSWTPNTLRSAAGIINAKCAPSGYQKPWIYTASDYTYST